ncbi:MAG: RDD family protein [Gammaproteobacteria bacterium]|nr:RDD family protein [Gammaproteobacteria bacterium]
MSKTTPTDTIQTAGLFPRLAAMVYDAFLLLATLFLAAALVLPLAEDGAISAGNPLFTSYLFIVCFFFNAWFWTRCGQTLGMRTWKIRIESVNGGPISWWQALLRFLISLVSIAFLGLGYFWILIDKKNRSWHDIYSETRIVKVSS